jgi:hypothetical protein
MRLTIDLEYPCTAFEEIAEGKNSQAQIDNTDTPRIPMTRLERLIFLPKKNGRYYYRSESILLCVYKVVESGTETMLSWSY